jgi:ribonuclease HI
MTIHAWTDGAARGNPGESGIGVILRDDAGNDLYSFGGFLGTATNNVAEYRALLHCLEKAAGFTCESMVVHSDSQLMVRQMLGQYKVKDKKLAVLHREAKRLVQALPFTVTFVHVERELNRDADLLANAGIDGKVPCEF